MQVFLSIKVSLAISTERRMRFVSAYRKYKDTLKFDIHIEYIASPRIDDKTLIITDPMLATGGSMELSYQAMLTKGHPAEIHVASIIASQTGYRSYKECISGRQDDNLVRCHRS